MFTNARVLGRVWTVALLLAAATAGASAQVTGSLTLAWDANLTDADLAGYRAFAHTDPNVYALTPAQAAAVARTISVGVAVTTATFTGLDATRTWHFAVTSRDASGNESPFSAVVSGTPSTAPTVRTVSPASALQGATGVGVTITGQNFLAASTVSLGAGVTVTLLNTAGAPTTLVATVNIDPLARVASRDVAVTNPGGAIGTRTAGFAVDFDTARADIDLSGTVDGADFVDLLLGFPSVAGDANYNVRRDLDGDGRIDGADFAFFFSVF